MRIACSNVSWVVIASGDRCEDSAAIVTSNTSFSITCAGAGLDAVFRIRFLRHLDILLELQPLQTGTAIVLYGK